MDNGHEPKAYEQSRRTPRNRWSLRRKIIGGAVILLVVFIALGVGLGVGLTQRSSSSGAPSPPQTTVSPVSPPTNPTNTTGLWTPKNGTTWNYELQNPLNSTSPKVEVWDIDLFDNDVSIISGLQGAGGRVICYFSAGSYENWRPDADKFQSIDLGKDLDGWPGERWLNTNSTNVRNIMLARLDLAVQKNCDGVDPDNIDGYNNDNGFGLTPEDAINYVEFLATGAHSRNLSLGLKNAGEIVPNVINRMQWSVNEQCVQYDECDTFMPFIQQGKPVFHVEYPKGDNTNNDIAVSSSSKSSICDDTSAKGFSTIIKNMNLDDWIETCPDLG